MAPKKAAAAKPKATAGTHASYLDMIKMAIVNLKDRKGSSRQAIKKYIKANNNLGNTSDGQFNSHINRALAAGEESGAFERPKGPSGPVKLKKPASAPKPAASKAAPKPAPKPAATKKSASTKTKKPAGEKKPKAVTKKIAPKAKVSTAAKAAAPAVDNKPAVVTGKTKSGRVTKSKAPQSSTKKAATKKTTAKKPAAKKASADTKKEA